MEKGDFCDVISARDNSLSVICSVILSLYHGCIMHVFSHLTDLNLISFYKYAILACIWMFKH